MHVLLAFRKYSLPLLVLACTLTACNNDQHIIVPADDGLPNSIPNNIVTGPGNNGKVDTISSWENFRKGSIQKLKENKMQIDAFKLQISIGIGPRHDSLFKSINQIAYKNEMLEEHLTAYKMGNNADFVSFYTQFNVAFIQVKDSLDKFVIN